MKSRKLNWRGAFLGITIGLIIVGFVGHGLGWLAGLGIVLLILWLIVLSSDRKDTALRRAPSDATRVETVKQVWVNQTVQQYAKAGWTVVGQSSAKSFGSEARITLTFKKS